MRYVLIAWMFAGLAAAESAPYTARAILSPPVTPFHRPAECALVLEGVPEELPTVPDWKPEIEGLEIREGVVTREPLEGGRQRVTYTYTVDPIKTGDYALPPITVGQGEESRAITPTLTLKVRDLTDSEREMASQFVEIIRPEQVEPQGLGAGAWTAIILALSALACVAYVLLRRKKEEVTTPPPPPWELASRRLAELLRRHPLESGRYEAYYVDLSAILRYYIEDRFNTHAPELTTQELLAAMSKLDLLNDEQRDFLSVFLRHCDHVKFARYRPSLEEMKGGYSAVQRFVTETTPQMPANEEEKAA